MSPRIRSISRTLAIAAATLGVAAPAYAQSAATTPPAAPVASLPITFFGEVRSRTEWDQPCAAYRFPPPD